MKLSMLLMWIFIVATIAGSAVLAHGQSTIYYNDMASPAAADMSHPDMSHIRPWTTIIQFEGGN